MRCILSVASFVTTFALLLSACDSLPKGKPVYEDEFQKKYEKTGGSLLGSPGFDPFSSSKEKESGSGLAVNAWLWRASLETVSFMPIAQVDAFGGGDYHRLAFLARNPEGTL